MDLDKDVLCNLTFKMTENYLSPYLHIELTEKGKDLVRDAVEQVKEGSTLEDLIQYLLDSPDIGAKRVAACLAQYSENDFGIAEDVLEIPEAQTVIKIKVTHPETFNFVGKMDGLNDLLAITRAPIAEGYGQFFKRPIYSAVGVINIDLTSVPYGIAQIIAHLLLTTTTEDILRSAIEIKSPCPQCATLLKSYTITDEIPVEGYRKDSAVLICPACKYAEYIPIEIRNNNV